MGWDAVVERFLKRSPLTVMAHLTLRRALAAPWLDTLFAEHAERQYVRSLLFSTVVDLEPIPQAGTPRWWRRTAGGRGNSRASSPSG
jgi:hypothetical protein